MNPIYLSPNVRLQANYARPKQSRQVGFTGIKEIKKKIEPKFIQEARQRKLEREEAELIKAAKELFTGTKDSVSNQLFNEQFFHYMLTGKTNRAFAKGDQAWKKLGEKILNDPAFASRVIETCKDNVEKSPLPDAYKEAAKANIEHIQTILNDPAIEKHKKHRESVDKTLGGFDYLCEKQDYHKKMTISLMALGLMALFLDPTGITALMYFAGGRYHNSKSSTITRDSEDFLREQKSMEMFSKSLKKKLKPNLREAIDASSKTEKTESREG